MFWHIWASDRKFHVVQWKVYKDLLVLNVWEINYGLLGI